MSNYLKLSKSYVSNDLLKNPSLNMLGPDVVKNGNFESDADWILFGAPNWQIVDGKAVSDGGSGSFRQEGLFTVGKVYSVTITVSDYVSGTLQVGVGSGPRYSITGNGTYTFTETAQPNVSFYIYSTSFEGAVEKVSARETGQIEYVDNGGFYNVGNGTDVTTLPGWYDYVVGGTPISKNVDTIGGKNNLVIVSTGPNQGAKYDLSSIPTGMEVNLKIESVTGDTDNGALFVDGFTPDNLGNIPTSSGSVDFTFVKQSGTNALYFRAGNNAAGTTNYYNISIQPTNVFAYGWERPPGEAQEGVTFSNNNVTMTGQVTKVYGNTSAYTSGTEVLLKFNVLSFTEGISFRVWTGTSFIEVKDLKLGENELRFNTTSYLTVFVLNTQNNSEDYEITFDSISVQEAKNQPKLIGISEVSTVSTPDNETVIISNRYTEGADQVTITYEPKEGVSRVDVKNYFQDRIIEAANSNNTVKVFDINPPVLIKDIISS
jgi:hypothetical protein